MLAMRARARGEFHGERETFRGDARESLYLERNPRIGNGSERALVHAEIAPAAARHETTDPADGQPEEDGRGPGVGHFAQRESPRHRVNEDGEQGEHQAAIEDESAAVHDHAFNETGARGLIEEPAKKSSAEKAGERDHEAEVVDVPAWDGEADGPPAEEEVAG